jgi:threonylcarbamoyladenosine tRNA methylthiotransferase MtaB
VAAEARVPRVAVRTLGCKVNRTESEAIAEDLLCRGVDIAGSGEAAEVVVVNTCTVTGEADAKARKAVRRALAGAGEPAVVVTGCLAAIDPEGVRALGDRVIVEIDRSLVASRVANLLGGRAAETTAPPGAAVVPARSGPAFLTRVMVKVQDGCDHRCSYCIVPDARGGPRSVPASSVEARVARLADAGTAEVVLTGVNIGRYADGGTDLAGLVERLGATGIRRIRVSSIEPLDLTEGLLAALARTPPVMPHLHVPLQSGCDGTLEAMRRGYTAAEFADALRRSRAALPGLAVTTDVIVGFPGESDADFAASLAFVEACAFTKLHVFRYSRRRGTPAADMPGQIPPPVIAARAAVMRALGEGLAARHAASRVGGIADVLIESARGVATAGTTEDYLRIEVEGSQASPGDVVRVRLVGGDGGGLLGVPEDDGAGVGS